VAKQPSTKEDKPSRASELLSKRVDVAKGNQTLSRDVKMPKWLKAFFGYFSGSWHELRQVRWPTRRATWGLTSAVILFTVVLAVFILGLDYGFEVLFKQVILK